MIKRNINKLIGVLFCGLITVQLLSAQIVSPFNQLRVTDSSCNYSFIVSGHFHGASTNLSTFPASTLLANIDILNALHPKFLMSLGDMFLDVNESYLEHYKRSLFEKLKMPLLNAVGNHDLSNGNMYEKVFGQTYFSFTDHSELFIVLNTELNDGSIKGEQFKFLKTTLTKAKSDRIKNIFIFSHRPVWAEENSKYSRLFEGNTRSQFGSPNFEKEIRPLLENSEAKIFWVSGSLAGGPASFFYDKDEKSSVTFMQTAIRDLPRDAVLQINVNDGNISFKGISLTGQKMEPIENYNIDFWKKTIPPETSFNYRLLPLLFFQMLKHYFFWIGFVSSLIFFFVLKWIFNRWKKRK